VCTSPGYLRETEEIVDNLARFQAAINYLDDRVGNVLDALEESGRREETVVLFTTEHGIPYPGAKWWCRSPDVETATIVDGPGPAFSERGTVEAVFSNVDVLPTLFDVLDVPVPERVEGVSFRDYLAGETDDPPREFAFTQYTAAGSEARGVVGRDYNLI
jgi:arylsulfatase A-like enzyme